MHRGLCMGRRGLMLLEIARLFHWKGYTCATMALIAGAGYAHHLMLTPKKMFTACSYYICAKVVAIWGQQALNT